MKAREAQRESEALVRSIGDNLPGGMLYQIVRDRDGNRRLTFLSEGVRSYFGRAPEEVLADQESFYDKIIPEDRDRLRKESERAFQTMSPFDVQVRIRTESRGIRWFHFASSPGINKTAQPTTAAWGWTSRSGGSP